VTGKKRGCHSCGAQTPGTESGDWIPDHVPPIALAEVEIIRFWFFKIRLPYKIHPTEWYLLPHCKFCSNRQGWRVKYIRYKLIEIVKKEMHSSQTVDVSDIFLKDMG